MPPGDIRCAVQKAGAWPFRWVGLRMGTPDGPVASLTGLFDLLVMSRAALSEKSEARRQPAETV